MTRAFKREKATTNADLPHAFTERADNTCEVCTAFWEDPRHRVWEKQETAAVASDESSVPLTREVGS